MQSVFSSASRRTVKVTSPSGRDGELKTDWTKPPALPLELRGAYGR